MENVFLGLARLLIRISLGTALKALSFYSDYPQGLVIQKLLARVKLKGIGYRV